MRAVFRARSAGAGTPESALLRRAAFRLGLQAGLIVAAVVGVLLTAAVLVVLRSQHSATDALLTDAVMRADDANDPPAGIWLVLQRPSGRASTSGLPPGVLDEATLARVARTGVAETRDVQAGRKEYRVKVVRRGQVTVGGVLDLRTAHTERQHLVLALSLVGGVGLLLAAASGAVLGVRAVHPLAIALRLQRRFVADASHELRTPLTLLTTRAQLLRRHVQRGAKPEAVLADIDHLVADTDNLTAVLEDLLLAADPRAGSASERIDVGLLVDGVVRASTAAARKRSVRLSMIDGGRPYVQGAPVALRRAVTALTDNAIRHAHRTVTVTVGLRDRHALIDVTDDGPGIDPELAPRLFERSTSSGDSAQEGRRRRFGLGLALVGEIVAQHGGRIETRAEPGGGATFRITLPSVSGPQHLPRNLSI